MGPDTEASPAVLPVADNSQLLAVDLYSHLLTKSESGRAVDAGEVLK